MNRFNNFQLVDYSGAGPTVVIADPIIDCGGLTFITFEIIIQSFAANTAKFWCQGGLDDGNLFLTPPIVDAVLGANTQVAANGYQIEEAGLGGVVRALVTYVTPPAFLKVNAEASGSPARTIIRAYGA